MAKAKTKKQTKTKNKGIFGKSFNLQSRKVQFFVVIGIVAILGGGYFTFKSFAATTVATIYASEIIDNPKGGALAPLQHVTEQQPGQKQNLTVAEFPAFAYINSNAKSQLRESLLRYSGQRVKVCAMARITNNLGPSDKNRILGFNIDDFIKTNRQSVQSEGDRLLTTEYSKICAKETIVVDFPAYTPQTTYTPNISLWTYYMNGSPNRIRVSSINVELVGSQGTSKNPPPPAPAPASQPAK